MRCRSAFLCFGLGVVCGYPSVLGIIAKACGEFVAGVTSAGEGGERRARLIRPLSAQHVQGLCVLVPSYGLEKVLRIWILERAIPVQVLTPNGGQKWPAPHGAVPLLSRCWSLHELKQHSMH